MTDAKALTYGTAWTATGRVRHIIDSRDPAALVTLCGTHVADRSPLGLDRAGAAARSSCRRCIAALPRP